VLVEGSSETVADFHAVFESQRLPITRLAYLLVRVEPVAEELAQEAFLRLFRNFGQVENPAGFLRTAVVRLALTWRTRDVMERERIAMTRTAHEQVGTEPDETWDAIGRLRPERAAVLVLRFYEDLSTNDISRILGCPQATVRSRTRRALNDLRKELEL
jgi:RNA polymerase sigma-70 factor (ECF subfamily)